MLETANLLETQKLELYTKLFAPGTSVAGVPHATLYRSTLNDAWFRLHFCYVVLLHPAPPLPAVYVLSALYLFSASL